MAPSTILAMRYHGEPKLSLEAVPVPALRPGEVQVKVAFCGALGCALFITLHHPDPRRFAHRHLRLVNSLPPLCSLRHER